MAGKGQQGLVVYTHFSLESEQKNGRHRGQEALLPIIGSLFGKGVACIRTKAMLDSDSWIGQAFRNIQSPLSRLAYDTLQQHTQALGCHVLGVTLKIAAWANSRVCVRRSRL